MNFRLQSAIIEKSGQKPEAANHSHSQKQKSEYIQSWYWLAFSTLESSIPNQERVLATFKLGLPTSINTTKQSPTDTPTGQPDLDYTSWRLFPNDSRLC